MHKKWWNYSEIVFVSRSCQLSYLHWWLWLWRNFLQKTGHHSSLQFSKHSNSHTFEWSKIDDWGNAWGHCVQISGHIRCPCLHSFFFNNVLYMEEQAYFIFLLSYLTLCPINKWSYFTILLWINKTAIIQHSWRNVLHHICKLQEISKQVLSTVWCPEIMKVNNFVF